MLFALARFRILALPGSKQHQKRFPSNRSLLPKPKISHTDGFILAKYALLVSVDQRTQKLFRRLYRQAMAAVLHLRWSPSWSLTQAALTHSSGVAASAVALAQRLKLSPREILLMRAAGYLHDLGKLTVPSEILDKPAKLAPEEWSIMKGHTYHTFHILNTIGGMPQMSEWAAFHHERLDGKGYPFRHKAKDLTLGARIMAVADIFTAITEDRPYREGMPRQEVISVLDKQVCNSALDGDIVSVLKDDYEGIDSTRREEQLDYGEKQQHLADIIGCLQEASV